MEKSNDDIALGKAAQFCARLAAADCSELERESCMRWRQEAPANELAFQQVSFAVTRVEQALVSDDRFKKMLDRAMSGTAVVAATENTRSEDRTRRRQREHGRYRKPMSIAAGLLLATVAMWFTLAQSGDDAQYATEIISAPDKTAREVTLNDGSIVHIDAGAQLSVAMHPHRREIRMLEGRAFFEVAHDAGRPFVVIANETETTALGTQFEVQMHEGQTTVTLVEGSVAVSGTTASVPWSERLVPGNQLRIGEGNVDRERSDVDLDSVIGWSRGWLIFHSTKLSDALREINRYSSKQVTLAEGSLADMTVAGSFIAGESDSIVTAIAEVLPIRVVDGGSREIILFKRY